MSDNCFFTADENTHIRGTIHTAHTAYTAHVMYTPCEGNASRGKVRVWVPLVYPSHVSAVCQAAAFFVPSLLVACGGADSDGNGAKYADIEGGIVAL